MIAALFPATALSNPWALLLPKDETCTGYAALVTLEAFVAIAICIFIIFNIGVSNIFASINGAFTVITGSFGYAISPSLIA